MIYSESFRRKQMQRLRFDVFERRRSLPLRPFSPNLRPRVLSTLFANLRFFVFRSYCDKSHPFSSEIRKRTRDDRSVPLHLDRGGGHRGEGK